MLKMFGHQKHISGSEDQTPDHNQRIISSFIHHRKVIILPQSGQIEQICANYT